jgi:hypothetical protein
LAGWRAALPGGLALAAALAGCAPPLPNGWERVHPGFSAPVYALLQDPAEPLVFLAGCDRQVVGGVPSSGGLLRSGDGGNHWSDSTRGLPQEATVTALAAAAGIAGRAGPTLIAGTRNHGIFLSTDSGLSWHEPGPAAQGKKLDWSLIEVQALAVLPAAPPATPPAIAIGSNGLGVFVSEDGGGSWQERNQGLRTLTVQALAADGGELIAGTWFGGLFRSTDRGRSWTPRSREWNRATVSSLRWGAGRLWAGLQSGGLLVAEPDGEAQLYAREVVSGAGVTAIEARAGRLVVGTDNRGVALGWIDRKLEYRNAGLDNRSVSAVLIDREDPRRILLGTWSGLYLARSPPNRTWPALGLALLALLLAYEGRRRWRRSIYAEIAATYRMLARPSLRQAVEVLWSEVVPRFRGRHGARALAGLARRLDWSTDPLRRPLAPLVRACLPFVGVVRKIQQQGIDQSSRESQAAALAKRAEVLERLAASDREDPAFLHFLAQQDRTSGLAYTAANLGQLGAYSEMLAQLLERRRELADSLAVVSLPAAAILHKVSLVPAQLARLSSPEDRALVLGRTLSELLLVLEDEKNRHRGNVGGRIGLEVFRQHLVGALRELRQRAEIQLELRSRVLPSRRETLVVVELRNTGQGHAENLEVRLDDSTGLKVLTRSRRLASLLKQQAVQLEFQVEHQRGERVRLSFHISWDDLERAGHQAVFADVIELRKDAERSMTFRPLRPNPYVVGRPLRESDVFIGRDETFRRIASSLEGANQDNVVVLMGQRRMGKTSVLRQLKARLGPGYAPVVVDLQGILGRGEGAFLWEIAAAICDGLDAIGITIEEPSSASFAEDPGWVFRHHFLRPAGEALGERRLLIAFDEFEVLAERIAAGDLSPRILPYFRSLMQHEEKISFVFAGTHRLDQLTGDYWGALFNLAIYLEVGNLHAEEVEELFLRPTREAFEIDPLALDKAVRVTGGHPHFCQLLAREMVELRNEELLGYLTIQDLNRITQRVVQKGQLHIAYLWDEASLDERLLLLALTELLATEGVATLATVRGLIEERYPKAGDCDLAFALRILLRKELLREENGRIELRIELLRYWMEQNRNVVDDTWLAGPGGRGQGEAGREVG